MTQGLRQRLKAGQTCVGGWIAVPSPVLAQAMVSCGFHWAAVDLEHGTMSAEDAQAVFIAIERAGAVPFARLPSADPYLARRLLDAGAGGLIIPVVEDVAAFSEFSRHCLYPPHGRRGVGLSRANLWGDSFESNLGFRPILVPQIETRAGVAAAAGLAALPEVDALFLGPYDLSADLGAPGIFDTAEFVAARDAVKAACAAAGKAVGIHQVAPDPEQLRQRVVEGFGFIAYSTDVLAMRAALGRPIAIVEK